MAERKTMKYKIYLVEYLGVHGATMDYLRSLKGILERISGVDVEILSNFSDTPGRDPFLVNQYDGRVWNKVVSLYRNYRRLSRLIDEYPEAVYIFVTYGNQIDISFIRILSKARHHVVDVRDLAAPEEAETAEMLYVFAKTYSHFTSCVISHAAFTDEFLMEIDYTGKVFHLPKTLCDSEECASNDSFQTSASGKMIQKFVKSFSVWLERGNVIGEDYDDGDDNPYNT
ncbi:MAG: hypothetical protein HDS98_00565 [Bacteroidales bacterium]|nr:hypothetical protein [Bacteroidales bacterium]MBD5338297.1 hypothetical protein [Bacteroides sp.]